MFVGGLNDNSLFGFCLPWKVSLISSLSFPRTERGLTGAEGRLSGGESNGLEATEQAVLQLGSGLCVSVSQNVKRGHLRDSMAFVGRTWIDML